MRCLAGSTAGLALVACSGDDAPDQSGISGGTQAMSTAPGSGTGTTHGSATSTTGTQDDTTTADQNSTTDDGPNFDLPEDLGGEHPCPAPEMLILLDRSMGMGRNVQNVWPPGGQWETSKLWIALEAVQSIVDTYERQIRFGLALFPGDKGDDVCSPIDDPCWQNALQQDTCKTGDNWECSDPLAEMSIDFGLDNGPAFDQLDPLTLPVCYGTPTAAGVSLAASELTSLADDEQQQVVILVTDGSAHCGDLVDEIHTLTADTEIELYVIGYTEDYMESWVALLNDASCAAQTAVGFPMGCEMTGDGWVAEDPDGPPLFYPVADPEQFLETLSDITASLDCVAG